MSFDEDTATGIRLAELLMDHRGAREWLDEAWNEAVHESVTTPDPEVDALANSDVSSIRYALVTQMLGKIADPTRSLMALQLGEAGEGAWDARSFATAVVLSWERDNQQVIGKSPDPYVSKPLRHRRKNSNMLSGASCARWYAGWRDSHSAIRSPGASARLDWRVSSRHFWESRAEGCVL